MVKAQKWENGSKKMSITDSQNTWLKKWLKQKLSEHKWSKQEWSKKKWLKLKR